MISLPISEMSFQEKLQAINLLWDSIGDSNSLDVSPAWHGKELAIRLENVKNGTSKFEDWEDVKKELQDLIS